MKNKWLRFGCFLTGYNENIVMSCSEVTAKAVKRYTSALLIICILWAFIGYTFTRRYLRADVFGAIGGAIIFVIIIIQVERQIILAVRNNKWMYGFRIVLALIMALLGSIIIDQIIFKDDIEQQKIIMLDEKVKKVLPAKTEELKRQIGELDSTISAKEKERSTIVDDIYKNPTIKIINTQTAPVLTTSTTTDSIKNTTSKQTLVNSTSSTVSSIQNPKMAMIGPLDISVASLRRQMAQKDSSLIVLRTTLEEELNLKVGFLDELKLMLGLIFESKAVLGVWLLWLFFLLSLELFILVSKIGEGDNDYDATILHQMNLQKRKLELMSRSIKMD
jgi:hypothetical protein